MSDESRVLLDMATLAEVDGEKVRARKLREAYDYLFNLERKVTSLEDGECRRHCRVRAEMWKTGFIWGVRHINLSHGITKPRPLSDADKQYLIWRANDGKEKSKHTQSCW